MPEIIETSITSAWQRAASLARKSPHQEVTNLIVSVEGLSSGAQLESPSVRLLLDDALEAERKHRISTVASTIFPTSLWRPTSPRAELYERYLRLWPRIVKCQQNRRGTYFQRLIGYPNAQEPTFNQLEFVISAFNGGTRRRSAMQCGILVPHLDLNPTPYQGFPCMQQLSFHKEGANGLRVTALYPMHYLWARAYGNYLGLINLGRFMAHEMNLTLEAMTCVALVAKLDNPTAATPFLGGR